MPQSPYVRWFSDIRLDDVALVGGKTASLGELYSTLSGQDIRVPNGFAITARAYYDALTAADAWGTLHGLLDRLEKQTWSGLKPVPPKRGASCTKLQGGPICATKL